MGDAKSWANVFARNTAQRKEPQPLTGLDHCAGVAIGDRWRPALGDEEEQRFELVDRLGRIDDSVLDQALAATFFNAFACAAASRALTAPTATERDGLDLSAS